MKRLLISLIIFTLLSLFFVNIFSYKSILLANGNGLWVQINSGLGNLNVNSIAIDPLDSQTIYAGTNGGLYKSINGGNNWSLLGLSSRTIYSIAIDPTNTQIIFLGTDDDIYKTLDGGLNWNHYNLAILNRYVLSIAIDLNNSQTIYAGTNGGLYKSTNGGSSWSQKDLSFYIIFSIAIDPNNSQIIYAGTNLGVHKSTNGGNNWSIVLSVSLINYTLAIDPTNSQIIYAGAFLGVRKTTNSGSNWSIMDLLTQTVRSIVIDPNNTQTIYAGTNGGGVYKSTDGGSNWTTLNDGLLNLQIFSLDIDNNNTNILYSGTNGGGVFKYLPYYTLTVNIGGNGNVIKNPDELQYLYGSNVELTANSDIGYHFVNWSGDVLSGHEIDNPLIVTMNSNKTITANFEINTYIITATAGLNGSISPSGSVYVTHGSDRTFNFYPDIGYRVSDVTVDGISQGIIPSYTFTNITGPHIIHVDFEVDCIPFFDTKSDLRVCIDLRTPLAPRWKVIIPSKGYDTGWIPFDRYVSSGNHFWGEYSDKRYKFLIDFYSPNRYHIIFYDRYTNISIKIAN